MSAEDSERERLIGLERALLRRWEAFLAGCERDGVDKTTLLAGLAVNIGYLLEEHVDVAGVWLRGVGERIFRAQELQMQEPN